MASPDQDLEFVIIDIMGFTLTYPVGLALPQSYVVMLEEFCSIDVDDVYEFTYTDKSNGILDTKLHFMLVKQVQRCIHYTHYKEAKNDEQSNNPTLWIKSEYTTWCRNGYANWLASLIPAPTTPLLPLTSMTAAYVSPVQKDDDAALISWNRKPRDVAKYLLSYTSHKVRAYADGQTSGIQPTKEHPRDIHYTNSAFNNTNTNTLVVDSNNTRIISPSHFNIKPLNQIHCSLFGITRALAIASQ
jgi:hypothetical protein